MPSSSPLQAQNSRIDREGAKDTKIFLRLRRKKLFAVFVSSRFNFSAHG